MRNSTKYWISIDGEQKGPYVIANLMEMQLPAKTKVWKEDDEEWKIITEYPELTPYVVENKTDIPGKSRNVVWGVVSGILAVVVIILFLNLSSQKEEIEMFKSDMKEIEIYVEQILSESEKIKESYNDITSVYPFKITDIKIGNRKDGKVIDNYRSILYSSTDLYAYDIRYFSPKIYFSGYVDKSVEIYYKIYNPDGTLHNPSYSSKYTGVSTTVEINRDEDKSAILKGWGNNNYSTYKSGRYRIEVWCAGICYRSCYFDIK
ncbi:MAG TPA: DUF4339 domain-containing protein [Bacteroidales bacterium]|nr:DUF4339 domain-containing protein [Bacteroidales bacterium]HQO08023.1 DUF4339 domain-containing protein [Bacteroidales bacterium]HQP52505.1 DUF4339 domain-containing protein [Bacteroidales bacterium]